jgi:hypothetical protein
MVALRRAREPPTSGTAIQKPARAAWKSLQPPQLPRLFFNMDRMIGKEFQTGLANLKAAAEK